MELHLFYPLQVSEFTAKSQKNNIFEVLNTAATGNLTTLPLLRMENLLVQITRRD